MKTRVRMACFAIAALLVLLGPGCGGGGSEDAEAEAPAGTEVADDMDLVQAMEALAAQACACVDQPCAKKVDERVRAIFDTENPPEDLSEEDVGKIMMSMFQAAGCLSQYGV